MECVLPEHGLVHKPWYLQLRQLLVNQGAQVATVHGQETPSHVRAHPGVAEWRDTLVQQTLRWEHFQNMYNCNKYEITTLSLLLNFFHYHYYY